MSEGVVKSYNTWLLGTMVSLIGLLTIVVNMGVAIGSTNQRLLEVEKIAIQSQSDSKAIISMGKDIDHIKGAVDELRARPVLAARYAMGYDDINCDNDKPIYVASHCRGIPNLSVMANRQ